MAWRAKPLVEEEQKSLLQAWPTTQTKYTNFQMKNICDIV